VNKVFPDANAACADIPTGASLLVGGFGLCGIPEECIFALRELGPRDLTIVSNNAGTTDHGLVHLLKNRQVKKMISSYVGENQVFEPQGLAEFNLGRWQRGSRQRLSGNLVDQRTELVRRDAKAIRTTSYIEFDHICVQSR